MFYAITNPIDFTKMTSIEEVIQKMDEIVAECKANKSRIGYFAVLYRQVTIRIKEGIEQLEFEDNQRMEQLDILFAQRFFTAYELYRGSTTPTKSWLYAFEAANSGRHLVLQHLLLGINAHINLDLGIAAAETMSGKPIAEIKNDFDKINHILAEMVDGVKANISMISPIFGLLVQFANGKDEMLLNFSIRLARDGAWKFAMEYLHAPNRPECIGHRDQAISVLANKLVQPGRWLRWLVRLISLAEWQAIPKVMDQLEFIAHKNAPESLKSEKESTNI